MEFLNNYILLVVVGICLCVGYILKELIPGKGINRFIPLIMGVLGTLVSIWLAGWTVTPETVLEGLISGLASTGMYELFTQFLKKGIC